MSWFIEILSVIVILFFFFSVGWSCLLYFLNNFWNKVNFLWFGDMLMMLVVEERYCEDGVEVVCGGFFVVVFSVCRLGFKLFFVMCK